MQPILLSETMHILRFDRNDDVIELLKKYCKEHEILSGAFTGLGAAGEITLSYYNLAMKTYEDKKFSEDLEITGLTGNIALMEGETIIHAHGVFGSNNYSAVTGHVKRLIVSATCEIHLTLLPGIMKRSFDDATGLNLLTQE
jgi:predicted DNA-binding protein with PD1-like motif